MSNIEIIEQAIASLVESAKNFIEPAKKFADFINLPEAACIIKLMWGANHSSGKHNVDNRTVFNEMLKKIGLEHRQHDYIWMDTQDPFHPFIKMLLCATEGLKQIRMYKANLNTNESELVFLIEYPEEFNLEHFLSEFYSKQYELHAEHMQKAAECAAVYVAPFQVDPALHSAG